MSVSFASRQRINRGFRDANRADREAKAEAKASLARSLKASKALIAEDEANKAFHEQRFNEQLNLYVAKYGHKPTGL